MTDKEALLEQAKIRLGNVLYYEETMTTGQVIIYCQEILETMKTEYCRHSMITMGRCFFCKGAVDDGQK